MQDLAPIGTLIKLKIIYYHTRKSQKENNDFYFKYQSVIRSTMYAICQTRFNIISIINYLAQFFANPNKVYYTAVKHIF